jgi:2-polyprenyl-6-hydroxyphenyl methylase/3-demethylubiquinone-9 3-methyltransferase
MEKSTIDKIEIEKFNNLASQWWQNNGDFAILHHINPIRISYIKDKIHEYFNKERSSIKILDVGCGGGLVSMPLSRIGFNVTAIDAGEENIKIAKQYSENHKIEIQLFHESSEVHLERKIKYDVIICLEMIEHVSDPKILIDSLAKLLNKGGIIIISTINRTLKAKILAIGFAEYVLNLVPKNTHHFDKFVKPSEIAEYFEKTNLKIQEIKGMEFDLFSREWVLSKNIDINYICIIN